MQLSFSRSFLVSRACNNGPKNGVQIKFEASIQ